MSLSKYLIGQRAATRETKFNELQRSYSQADLADWYLLPAGQRAQLIKSGEGRTGVLMLGTELV
ncbi:malate:quinone oxidoreductase [Rhodococcus sp. T2V]|uniref:malate:quinone oxidoreductase n=1 Tax=Rhodococcus sp. T2V TaxID=3034164 RepID=UPI0034E208C2